MKFKKEELNFLKLYATLSDTKGFSNNKLNIKFNKETNEIIFSQLSYKFNFITKVSKDLSSLEKSEEMTLETDKIYQIINSLPDETEFDLTYDKKGIKFNDSEYSFKTFDGDYSVVNDFIDLKDGEEIFINDLTKMALLKSYSGQDKLDTIFLINGKFCASNRSDITGIIDTKNDSSLKIFFPSDFVYINSMFDIDNISLYKKDNISYFKINNTIIIVNDVTYSDELNGILDDDIRAYYDHETKVVISKSTLVESLKRISIIAKNNIFNRIFISFDTNNIVMESIDVGYSVEKVPFISIDDDIKNVKVIISANNLKTILSSLEGENINIKISSDADAVALSFEDENKNRIFIHNLYDDINS